MNTNELYHHGVKGQKWGVRRYQNPDGSLTDVSRKEYKKSLTNDKRIRGDLEINAYDSARFANLYSKLSKSYSKKYERAISKDPTKSSSETQRIENTKSLLDLNAKIWNSYNSNNVRKLKEHVDNMISKYADTKIKDIDVKTKKNGVEYIKSHSAAIANANVSYSLNKKRDYQRNADIYTPLKTSYDYYYI